MHLCPHESDILIKDITQKIDHIVAMKSLMQLFCHAICCFQNKELFRFDAQVGENLCQIRAYKIYQLNQSISFGISLDVLKKKMTTSIAILDDKEREYSYWVTRNKADRPSYIRDSLRLSDFFIQMNVIVRFEDDMFFIYLCYFLCRYCVRDEEKIPFTMNYNLIQQELNISRSFSKRMVHYYQKHLSELSCNVIFKLLSDLPEHKAWSSILHLLHKKADEGRMVLPCFLVTKIIIRHMIQTELEMILLCKLKGSLWTLPVVFLFKGNPNTNNFNVIPRHQTGLDSNYLIFYGEHAASDEKSPEKFLSRIHEVGLKNIILYNNAAHPQFSGKALCDFRSDPFAQLIKENGDKLTSIDMEMLEKLSKKIVEYKNFAIKLGCTKEFRRLFLLKHIFCDHGGNYNDFIRI